MNRQLLLAVITCVCAVSVQCATTCCAQSKSDATEFATIDAKTRWSLRAVATPVVSSSIIRLGDVVRPLDPKMPLWQRMKSAPIAMFPVNVNTMTIDRDRLDKAIRKAEATPRVIDWYGPEQIKVARLSPSQTRNGRNITVDLPSGDIAQASYQQRPSSVGQGNSQRENYVASTINDSAAKRISHWIQNGIDRELPEIAKSFEIKIDPRQPAMASLVSISGLTMVEPVDPVTTGTCRFRVVGRSADGPIHSLVNIELAAYPKIVVPRTALARGHRISESDLTITSIRPDQIATGQITDIQDIVGMEVRTTLRSGRPIDINHIGSPILIHRGDLVQVRVLSGGVMVKTNAKSQGDGSESDLIEIETMRPRKRLVARVVQTGLVEIVTRAPSMRYRESSKR